MSELECCPRCGEQAAINKEETFIYCTGCPLSVCEDNCDKRYLIGVWNGLKGTLRPPKPEGEED